MWLINLAISLFSVLKVDTLECLSLINRECMPKILNVNEGIGEALFYPYNVLVNKCSGSCETPNVLWHESCKCVCRLNSSVCNSKQIWSSDTCRCDCNEDFAGIISFDKGYTWNPSTCECQCDKWCKLGQNCVCKNKLVGRLIEECTSVINETMINNKDSCNNTLRNVFIGLFSVLLLVGVICICVIIFKYIKSKKIFKKYIDY